MFNNDKVALYLDFGHGGTDNGSKWYDGSNEKDYNLKIGLLVYNILKPHFKNLRLSRNQDITMSLQDRTNKMNDYSKEFDKVEVYSFHTNAFNNKTTGIEILLSIFNDFDVDFITYFLKEYVKLTGITNRGIVKRKSTSYPGKDYYWLHRNSNSKCSVKIIEFGFGDTSTDGKILNSKINDIAKFTAQKIAERFGITLSNEKTWEDMIKEVSDYSDTWINFINSHHSPALNLKGLIEKLYWHKPK